MVNNESQFLLRQNQYEEEKREKDNELAVLRKNLEAAIKASKLKVSSLEAENAALISNQAAALSQIQEEAQSAMREQEANAAEMVSTLEVQHQSLIQAKQLEIAAAQAACKESESIIQAKQSEIAAVLAMSKTSDAKIAELKAELHSKVQNEAKQKSENGQAKLRITELETKIAELESSIKNSQTQAEPDKIDEHLGENAELHFETSNPPSSRNPQKEASTVMPLPIPSNDHREIENKDNKEADQIAKPKQSKSNSTRRNARRKQGISKQLALMFAINT